MPSQTFTTPGLTTFTVPPGLGTITVECWGAGGGGGIASGGGGGAYSRSVKNYPDIQPGQVFDIYIGNGGAANNFGSGADGETTYFYDPSYISAAPGKGIGILGGPNGGQASDCVGDVTFSGGNGVTDGSGGGAGGGAGASGDGGNGSGNGGGPGGSGGGGDGGNGSLSVGDGTQPGGGGGGFAGSNGNGANGMIVITYDDPLDHFTFTNTPTSVLSGTNFGFTVVAKTASNATMTWYFGAAPYVQIASNAPHGSYTTPLALVNGVATINTAVANPTNITSLGTFQLTADDSQVSSTVCPNIIVKPHSAAALFNL